MDLDSFIVSIFFDNKATQDSAKKIEDTVIGLKNKIIGAFSAIAAMDFLKNAVKSSVELATKLDNLSYATNVSKENLTAWGEAVKRNGGTAEGFYTSVSSLADKIREMQTSFGSPGQLVFARLGLNLRDANGHIKNAVQLLGDLGNKFQTLPKAWQMNLGHQLGLDNNTIRLISQGSAEAQKLVQKMAQYAQINTLNTERNIKFRNSLYDVSLVFDSIKLKIANDLLPAAQKFSELLLSALLYLQKHSSVVKIALIAVSTILSGVLLASLVSVTRAIIAMGVAFAATPIGFLTLALTGIALLLQDFIVYLNGGKSAFQGFYDAIFKSDILDKLDKFADRIKIAFAPLIKFFDKAADAIRNFLGIKQIDDPLQKDIDDAKKIYEGANHDSIADRIRKNALELGVDPDVALRVAKHESGFNPGAQNSRSSASGIFQLTNATALSNGITDLSQKNNIDANIRAGVLNLKKITDGLTNYFHRAPTPAEISIGEMLGLAGSQRVFSANKNTMLSSLFGSGVLNANPQFRNMTAGQLINNANKTFKQQSVTVGDVNINAPNSNAKDISKKIKTELNKHLSMTVTNFDNGVLA